MPQAGQLSGGSTTAAAFHCVHGALAHWLRPCLPAPIPCISTHLLLQPRQRSALGRHLPLQRMCQLLQPSHLLLGSGGSRLGCGTRLCKEEGVWERQPGQHVSGAR